MAYGFNALTISLYNVVHGAWRNNYAGPSSYDFHIWSDDIVLCAKVKAYGRGKEPS